MQSIYRFYKMNPQSIESLETPLIYLSNARKWENAGEFDFEIDIASLKDYKVFLRQYLVSGFNLKPQENGFNEFNNFRKSILRKYNREYLYGEMGEYIFLYYVLFQEIQTTEGLKERQCLIKNTFFNRTGVSCFTIDESCFADEDFWQNFGNLGNGFCIEYDFDKLKEFLRLNEIGYGQPIQYKNDKAKLKVTESDIYKTKANYKEIIFSLNQSFREEKEYRLAVIYEDDVADDDIKRKLFISREVIASVTIGYNLCPTDLALIQKITLEKLCCDSLYKINNQHGYLHRFRL